MASTTTPNMGLIVPTVSQEPGPQWATDINASLGILDQHDHTANQGVQIPTAGININADLAINSNNLVTVKTIRFAAQSVSFPGTAPNLGCAYVAGNELYYNDIAGNVVAITNNGSVNAGAGSITGLPSGTASASYSAGSQTFVWQSATSTPANLDAGSVILRNVLASSNGVTINAPAALASNYSLTVPLAPAQTSIIQIDNTGAMSAVTAGTSSVARGLDVASGVIGVANHGITQVMRAAMTSGPVALAGEFAVSASCGTFTTSTTAPVAITNLSVTLTTTGRPVAVGFKSIGGGPISKIAVASGASYIINNTTNSYNVVDCTLGIGSGSMAIPVETFSDIDLSVLGIPGTYTYDAFVENVSGSTTILEAALYAYEI